MGEPRYTEKEMVMAKREAFESGAHWFYGREETPRELGYLPEIAATVAKKCYPLPKVERPRVVTDEWGHAWRVIGDVIEVCCNGEWESPSGFEFNKERVLILADLLSHPSEFVDDEG